MFFKAAIKNTFKNGQTNGGFTLVEVLVALFILALALPALTFTIIGLIQGSAALRDQMFAQWVAVNKMTDTRIRNRLNEWPDKGKTSGSIALAEQEWFWDMTLSETGTEDFRRIDIEVRSDQNSDYALAMLTGFIRKRPQAIQNNTGSGNNAGAGNGGSNTIGTGTKIGATES